LISVAIGERTVRTRVVKNYALGLGSMGVRTQKQMGSADPPGKMDEKLKSENMQKRAFFSTSEYTIS